VGVFEIICQHLSFLHNPVTTDPTRLREVVEGLRALMAILLVSGLEDIYGAPFKRATKSHALLVHVIFDMVPLPEDDGRAVRAMCQPDAKVDLPDLVILASRCSDRALLDHDQFGTKTALETAADGNNHMAVIALVSVSDDAGVPCCVFGTDDDKKAMQLADKGKSGVEQIYAGQMKDAIASASKKAKLMRGRIVNNARPVLIDDAKLPPVLAQLVCLFFYPVL
jgi:hypothetical protein